MLRKTMDALINELERLDSLPVDDEHLGDEISRAKAVSSIATQSVQVSRQVTDVIRLRAELADDEDDAVKGLLNA